MIKSHGIGWVIRIQTVILSMESMGLWHVGKYACTILTKTEKAEKLCETRDLSVTTN